MKPIPGRSDTFINSDAKDFELIREAHGKYSEVKLWQIAHRIRVGETLRRSRPSMITKMFVWEISEIVDRGVVVVLRCDPSHKSLIEWLSSVWIEGCALYDESARTYDRAREFAGAVMAAASKIS